MRKITIKWNEISAGTQNGNHQSKIYMAMQDNRIKQIGLSLPLASLSAQGYSVWEGSFAAESLEITDRLINRIHHLLEVVNKPETNNANDGATEGMVINIENIGCSHLVRNIGALA